MAGWPTRWRSCSGWSSPTIWSHCWCLWSPVMLPTGWPTTSPGAALLALPPGYCLALPPPRSFTSASGRKICIVCYGCRCMCWRYGTGWHQAERLVLFARHADAVSPELTVTPRVAAMEAKETEFGLREMSTYIRFNEKVRATKRSMLRFLLEAREHGKTVVAYGAAAKGVTLVNYCGVREDLVDYVVDRSPHKQNHFLPGVRIPIHAPRRIFETKPDYVVILPWNLRREISEQMAGIREWGGKFVVPIPTVEVF
ncbi:MAG: hypothetical protein HC828_12055 [Blastochloris sp.]|nr:hypothetical protein [Blastochloris sp.]